MSDSGQTPYRRFVRIWAYVIVAGLALILLFLYVSGWFVVPFFGLIFLIPYFLRNLACPHCGTPLTYQGTWAGTRITGGLPRRKCQECGWDLTRSS